MVGRLQVLVLSHLYPASVDKLNGWFVHRSVQGIADQGMRPRVLCPVPWAPRVLWLRKKWEAYGRWPDEEVCDGIEVGYPRYPEFPGEWFRAYSGLSMYAALRGKVARYMKGALPVLIHGHTLTPDGLCAVRLAKDLGVPVIVSVRGSDLHDYPFRSKSRMNATRSVLRAADAVVTTSQALKQQALDLEKGIVSIQVIYNGVDVSEFRRRNMPAGAKEKIGLASNTVVITTVGRCEREKGVFDLLRAFRQVVVGRSDVVLLFVGGGKDLERIRREALLSGVQEHVRFLGSVPHHSVRGVLEATDIFAFPSHGEGMPNALLEAMAIGLPCIATRVGGIPEVLEDEVTGLLVTPGDINALTVAMRRCLAAPEWATEMGREARKKVKHKMSWERNAIDHVRLYGHLLNGRGIRRVSGVGA